MARKRQSEVESQDAEAAPPLRLEWRSPAELAENPRNWRRHPAEQTAALADVLSEVGWAGACLLNERTGRLIDGHARRKVAMEQGCERVPVLVGSWSEADEAKILATLDPLSAMARRDEDALRSLLADVATDSAPLRALLDSLAAPAPTLLPPAPDPAPPQDFPAYDETIPVEHRCPRCGYRWSGNGSVDEEDRDGDDGD